MLVSNKRVGQREIPMTLSGEATGSCETSSAEAGRTFVEVCRLTEYNDAKVASVDIGNALTNPTKASGARWEGRLPVHAQTIPVWQ
jgi:hypothetical protein